MRVCSNLYYQKKIYKVLEIWYNKEDLKIEEWLDRPWRLLEDYHLNGTFYTPRNLIELGRAEEVYKLIITCIGD